MGLEGIVILLVILLIIGGGWYGNGRWYGNRTGTPVSTGGGPNIIGLLITILVAIVVIYLIFWVLGGGIHLNR